jgi:NAD(P)-dependent dehydrogenase (short-subunit alcohol dehydrogenase family)
VVSGAGHGFGRCIAETFAQLGARVFGCDLCGAELAETAKAGVSIQVLDLTDRAAAAAWIAQIEQTTGGAVDVLVNNAGGVAEQEITPPLRGSASKRAGSWSRFISPSASTISRSSQKFRMPKPQACWRSSQRGAAV